MKPVNIFVGMIIVYILVVLCLIGITEVLKRTDPTGIRLISRTMKAEINKSLGIQTQMKTEYVIQNKKYGMWFDVYVNTHKAAAHEQYKWHYDQFVERQFYTDNEKVILEYP